MKTSDEKLNEALRAALKRKFDDFEEQPNPAAYSRIRAQLREPRNYKFLFLTVLIVGLFVAGVMMDQQWSNEKGLWRLQTSTTKSQCETELSQVDNNTKWAKNNVKTTDGIQMEDSKDAAPPILGKKISISGLKKRSESHFSKKHLVLDQTIKTDLEVFQQNEQIISSEPIVEKVMPDVNTDDIADQNEPVTLLESEEKLDKTELAGISLPALEKMQSENTKFGTMKLPAISFSGESKNQNTIHTYTKKLSWIVNAASLKTYQIITVPKNAGTNFQNFKFPSVFSLESLGYKLSAGVEKKGFQLLVHYSGFRQSYSYEIAGSEYVVRNSDQNDIKVERQGTVVRENRKMEMLGLGINKQVEWGRSPFRNYFAAVGLEYSRMLNGGHNVGWINAGFGKQFSVNRQVLIKIGPYAEFSPVRISADGDPFYYQPYRVGISLGMKLIKP